MAIVCANSAEKFVENEVNFVIYCDLFKNTDVIVRNSKDTPKNIGVSYKKDYHLDIVSDHYGEANSTILMRNAMAYSLEKGDVDAIIIDALKAISLKKSKYNASKYNDYTTYVLLVNKEYMKTEDFKIFSKMYNRAVKDLQNKDTLIQAVESFTKTQMSKEEVELWKTLNLTIVPIEEQRK